MGLSDLTRKVNSSQFKVFIVDTAAGSEFTELQNARLLISHSEFRETTTSGGVVYYSGAPDNVLSGTLLYTVDQWERASTGWDALVTRINGEVPKKKITIRLQGESGGADDLVFDNAKVSVVDFSKPVEGGVKIDVSIVLPDNPTG